MKSLLSLGSDAPHVHLRLRKRLSRCTLDCGFKTPESPALRGFVVERCPITGTSLYLVLKSNGLRRPKIRLKKFGFSLKIVPATIAKKLPPQRWPQPLFIPLFNFSHKRPTFAFVGESVYTTRLLKKDRTQGHTRRNRGRFGRGRYYYPRSVPHVSETLRGRDLERQTLPLLGLGRGCSRRTQKACGTAMRLCASLFRGVAAPLGRVIFLLLSKLRLVCPVPDTSFGSPDAPACAVPVQAASQLGPFRLGVQWFSVETGRIFCYNFGKRVT